MGEQHDLCEFDMRSIGHNKILMFAGRLTPGDRGKSGFVIDYLYYNQDIPFCVCISPADDNNLTYRPHIPSKFIFDKYTPELLKGFVERQNQLDSHRYLNQRLENQKVSGTNHSSIDSRGIVIMDDCIIHSDWKKDKSLCQIFMNGRQMNITFVLTMQYQVNIPAEIRVNIDYVFICRENNKMEKEKLWKYYAGCFPTFELFDRTYERYTGDRQCLVVDCLSMSDKIEEQVFWYKEALIEESFHICDKFW